MSTKPRSLPRLERRRRISHAVLLLSACLTGLSTAVSAQTQLTAADAWLRIEHRYSPTPAPVPKKITDQAAAVDARDTVDTLKAGDPATPVTGIATTFLDTMDVLREAARRGDNLVITHEPTFYNHRDETVLFKDDYVYKEKLAFIKEHHLVVYRLHDQIHSDPAGDQILAGVYQAFGWEKYPRGPVPYGQNFVVIPRTTLRELAASLQARLHAATMRVEGDPNLVITHAALIPGAAGLETQVAALRLPEVEVLIAGEASEWETVEYVRDAVAQGRRKALILLGHQVSEEPGMELCARQLRELFPGLRVDHIPANQPLWNPAHPPAAK